MKNKLILLWTHLVHWLDEIGLFIITSLGAFLSPVKGVMAVVGLLVVADMITGVIAAKKSGKEIKSSKLFRTVAKFVVYGLFVMVAHAVELEFLKDWPATKLVAALIATIELKSLDENAKTLFGISFFDKIINLIAKRKEENNEDIR